MRVAEPFEALQVAARRHSGDAPRGRTSRSPLERKVLAACLIPFAAVVLSVAAAIEGVRELAASKSLLHFRERVSTASAAHAEAERALLSLAITREHSEVEAYVAAVDRMRAAFSGLTALAGSDPVTLRHLQRLEPLVAGEVSFARSVLRAPNLANETVRNRVASGRRHAVASALAALARHTDDRLRSGFFPLAGRPPAALRVVLLAGLLAAAAVGLAGAFFGTAVIGSVRRLLAGMKRIRDGALDYRAPVRPRDELGEVATGFNEMLDALVRTQTELKQSTELLRLVLDSMSDAVIVADGTGRLVLFNRAAVDILGEAPQRNGPADQTERCHLRSAGGRAASGHAEPLTAATRGCCTRNMELLVRNTKAGQDRCVIAAASPISDGDTLWGGVLVLTDITERKLADRALADSEERFRAFVETTSEWIWSTDESGAITYSNPGLFPILGYFPGQVVGKCILGLIHTEERSRFSEKLAQIDAGRNGSMGLVFRCLHENGTERSLEMNMVPILDRNGVPAGARGIARDITLRRMAEAEVRKLNVELRRRIAQLDAVNKELEAFSYSVSHDLRAPLRSIDGFSQALLEDCLDKLDADGQDYLRRVRAASQRMAQLIDDLINLSRVARTELTRRTVDVSDLAACVSTGLQETQPDRDVVFTIAAGMSAEADPRLLRIVFDNLLGNAWKFTRTRKSARIEIGELWRHGERIFFVRDNGVGFDMDYAAKLFGAFQRLHAVEEFEGTGIGLATVQRIINRHGGRVWAEASVGEGATFYFTLS